MSVDEVASSDLIQQIKESLGVLAVKRKSLETEADAIVSELTDSSNGEPMGVDTPLVDNDGYPRADIDVLRARTLRRRLNEIRTDHKELEKNMETQLLQLAVLQNPQKSEQASNEQAARLRAKPKPKFDPVTKKWVVMNWDGTVAGVPDGQKKKFHDLTLQNEESISGAAALTVTLPDQTPSSSLATVVENSDASRPIARRVPSIPFARVNTVAEHSPAAAAGLLENDCIFQFGDISSDNTDNTLSAIGELVSRSAANQGTIAVLVKRSEDFVTLNLQPRPWNGRGLLGCHILPC